MVDINEPDIKEEGRKAGIKEVVKAIEAELVESDSRNMWYLNKRFWQAFLKEKGIVD